MGRPKGSKNKPAAEKNIVAPKDPGSNEMVPGNEDLDQLDDLHSVLLQGSVELPSAKDVALIQRMGAHMMTSREVCAILDISMAKWDASMGIQAAFQRGTEMGKGRIRRLQWKRAERDTVMLIWLGKQYLDQADKKEIKTDDGSKDAARQAFEDKLKSIIDVTPAGEADFVPDPGGDGGSQLLLAPVGEGQPDRADETIVVEAASNPEPS